MKIAFDFCGVKVVLVRDFRIHKDLVMFASEGIWFGSTHIVLPSYVIKKSFLHQKFIEENFTIMDLIKVKMDVNCASWGK